MNTQNQLANTGNQPTTMSSREIATLTGKEHRNVTVDIRKMLEELGEDVLTFQHIFLDGMNRDQTEYILDRELTETLLTGYSAVLRRKVLRRLRELDDAHTALLTASTPNNKYAQLGADLMDAVRWQEYDSCKELDAILDKVDFGPAARTEGVPEHIMRNRIAMYTAATVRLQHVAQGEHAHEDSVRSVISLAQATVKSENLKAQALLAQKNLEALQLAQAQRPQTFNQLEAQDFAQKHDNPDIPAGPAPRKRAVRKRS